jgi:phosphatidylserine decarboxylase
LSREGIPTILIVLASAVVLFFLSHHFRFVIGWILFGLNVAILLLVLYFFRDPQRVPPADPDLIVSPADGVVLEICEMEEPDFIGGKAMRVAIFLSPLDVHVNYVPYGGVVRYLKYVPGKFLRAFLPEASVQNEHQLIGLETFHGKLLFKQSTGILARRVVCRLQMGQSVKTGEKFGIMKFGSRMEVYLPAWGEFSCQKGDKLRAGVSVIGRVHATKKKS